MDFTINQLSDGALEIKLSEQINEETLLLVIKYAQILKDANLTGIQDITTSYGSIGVYFNPVQISFSTLKKKILNELDLMRQTKNKPLLAKTHTIPVCYGIEVAQDQKQYLNLIGMSQEDFIQLHSAQAYRVYMKGFLPGFIYLGGLPEKLHFDRKKNPILNVPPGSIAIGGQQTGMYGIESPGGWWIIGRTPLSLFSNSGNTIIITPGDKVKFNPISKSEFYNYGL